LVLKKTTHKSISLALKELRLLKEKKMGAVQLHSAKEQLIGQLAMAEESNLNFMLMMGKSLLDLNRIDTLAEIFESIKKVSAANLQDMPMKCLMKISLVY
jgi:predicted Zn-dependent peptidase